MLTIQITRAEQYKKSSIQLLEIVETERVAFELRNEGHLAIEATHHQKGNDQGEQSWKQFAPS